jgi:NAD(P)-dependent dehydrogenase (short-subunit alcohol dehydrogenase family)
MPVSDKRVVLVTGANKGIGHEVTRQLAQQGLHVYLGARNRSSGEAAAAALRAEGLDVQNIDIDLSLPDSIAAATTRIEAEFHRLDVLVNNAGIADAADGAPSKADVNAIRRVMDTNFLGAVAVTQAMLPLLTRSTSARIVNVSSGLGSLTLHADPNWEYAPYKVLGYCASKAALNMLTIQLAYELRDTTIKVNSADPGYTATDLNAHRGYQTVEQGAAEIVRLALLPDNGATGSFSSANGANPW